MASRTPQTVESSSPPVWPIAEFSQGYPVLVITPHPDDETLGCGGLLAGSFATTGAHVVCVTDGRFSHPRSKMWPGSRLAACRERELISAITELGGSATDITFLRYHDCHAPAEGMALERVAWIIAELCHVIGVRTFFCTASDDSHTDHVASAAIARRVRALRPTLRLFEYAIWSRWQDALEGTTQRHGVTFATRCWRARKAAAVYAHRSQLGLVVEDDPHGFAMPPGFADFFIRTDELFTEVGR